MFGLGIGEVIVIAILALVLIGPDQLPEVARTLGRFINDLKRSTDGLTEDIKKQTKMDDLNLDLDIHSILNKNEKKMSDDDYSKLISSEETAIKYSEPSSIVASDKGSESVDVKEILVEKISETEIKTDPPQKKDS